MNLTAKWCDESAGWKGWLVLALALSVAGCQAIGSDVSKRRDDGDGKGKKISSGRSYVEETTVAVTPTPAAAPGWDSERVWSGQDDWEPAVAVDPVNPNYVYQLTTRYTGPKACGNCRLPAIILHRSTDGGATWVEQLLSTSGKSQYDPQIVVDSTGWV